MKTFKINGVQIEANNQIEAVKKYKDSKVNDVETIKINGITFEKASKDIPCYSGQVPKDTYYYSCKEQEAKQIYAALKNQYSVNIAYRSPMKNDWVYVWVKPKEAHKVKYAKGSSYTLASDNYKTVYVIENAFVHNTKVMYNVNVKQTDLNTKRSSKWTEQSTENDIDRILSTGKLGSRKLIENKMITSNEVIQDSTDDSKMNDGPAANQIIMKCDKFYSKLHPIYSEMFDTLDLIENCDDDYAEEVWQKYYEAHDSLDKCLNRLRDASRLAKKLKDSKVNSTK